MALSTDPNIVTILQPNLLMRGPAIIPEINMIFQENVTQKLEHERVNIEEGSTSIVT